MKAFVSLEALANAAEARGMRVDRFGHTKVETLEIFVPEHEGPDGAHWYGATYSCADVVVSDRCELGYGYNPFFHGPYHPGLCRRESYGFRKLMSHPLMQGATL